MSSQNGKYKSFSNTRRKASSEDEVAMAEKQLKVVMQELNRIFPFQSIAISPIPPDANIDNSKFPFLISVVLNGKEINLDISKIQTNAEIGKQTVAPLIMSIANHIFSTALSTLINKR